ncbi:MAG: hypothetical protein M1831_002300 [Alyxoria varia]|nr:MAG: hypothetical protein M1831_002300 [Alyxoria varia]
MAEQYNNGKRDDAKKNSNEVKECQVSPTYTTDSETAFDPYWPKKNSEGRTFLLSNSSNESEAEIEERAAAAAAATEAEHNLSLLEGVKRYKKAVAWSVFLSTCCVMEGYDIVLIASSFSVEAFNKNFGEKIYPHGTASPPTYELQTYWQASITNGCLIGEIIGIIICGHVVERFGYRRALIGALAVTCCFIFLTFFAVDIRMLLIGEIMCGIPWGFFQTIPPAYAADICPTCLKPYLTTYVNLCWVMGQLIGSGVLRATGTRNDNWAWRIPFGLQWMWPIPLIVGISLAPESAWWLVRKGRTQDARRVLTRLYSANRENDALSDASRPSSKSPNEKNQARPLTSKETIDNALSLIIHTDAHERAISARNRPSYTQCLKPGPSLRRTEISAMAWASQILCGSPLMAFSTYFYKQAGLEPSTAFTMTFGQYGLGVLGTFFAWFLMTRAGRRRIYLGGVATLLVLLLGIGLCGALRPGAASAQWTIASLLVIYTAVYDSTIGPVCYSIVSEVPSARLRPKTVTLARAAYNITAIAANTLTPMMLNPGALNWGAKATFLFAGTGSCVFVWCFFRLPEVKGRTVDELDTLFEGRIPARKFGSVVVGAGGGCDRNSGDGNANEKSRTDHASDEGSAPQGESGKVDADRNGATNEKTPIPTSADTPYIANGTLPASSKASIHDSNSHADADADADRPRGRTRTRSHPKGILKNPTTPTAPSSTNQPASPFEPPSVRAEKNSPTTARRDVGAGVTHEQIMDAIATAKKSNVRSFTPFAPRPLNYPVSEFGLTPFDDERISRAQQDDAEEKALRAPKAKRHKRKQYSGTASLDAPKTAVDSESTGAEGASTSPADADAIRVTKPRPTEDFEITSSDNPTPTVNDESASGVVSASTKQKDAGTGKVKKPRPMEDFGITSLDKQEAAEKARRKNNR